MNAARLARSVPLVTVVVHDEIVEREGDLVIPGDNLNNAKTRQVELACGMEPTRYFYAGRAYPKGDVGLVFSWEVEAAHTGSAYPFDTGGVFHGKAHPVQNDRAAAIRLIRETRVDLSVWRTALREYLEAFFPQAGDYLTNRAPDHAGTWGHAQLPAKDARNQEWRCWTWEVGLHQGLSVATGLDSWACTDGAYQGLLRAARQDPRPLPVGGGAIRRLVQKRPIAIDRDFRAELEKRIREACL